MLNTGDIRWLSELSRISFEDGELEVMERDMASIIALMDTLKDVDLPREESGAAYADLSGLRDDSGLDSLPASVLLSQCKHVQDGCFAIPKVVE